MIKKIICIVSILVLNVSPLNAEKITPTSKQLENLSLDGIDNIMIVAHPDDEVIWGGDHLLKEHYLVVCLTNGNNKIRSKEFQEVMEKSNSKGIILNYPDKTKGKRDSWKNVKKDIKKDIEYLLQLKKWKTIVTHNPNGEYGHKHHQMTSSMVTKICKKDKLTKNLFYFGHYHKKSRMYEVDKKTAITKKRLQKKNQLLDSYSSQQKVKDNLEHMFPYEQWIPYSDWKK